MATRRGYFILTEAAKMLPLVSRILRDVREARSRLASLDRRLRCGDADRRSLIAERSRWRSRLADCLQEALSLGVEITAGIRCEALFPFEHQWVGPQGDHKLRPAYFVYNDAATTIAEWFFSGWPNDRRQVNARWWHQFRPTPVKRAPRQQTV